MKSKIHKGLIVKSELKPVVSAKSKDFVYRTGSDLAAKFKAIYEAQAAAKVDNVTPIKKKVAK